jgi:hypothetical protein
LGQTEVVDLLLKSGASPFVVNNKVIKHSVKLRQSNINAAVLSIKTAFNLVKIHLLFRIMPLIQ